MTKLWLPSHHAKRVAPVEFRDAVESWARQYSGHGDVVWVDNPINCWAVRLSLMPGDPRLKHPDEGTHFEQTLLHEWVDPRRDPSHPKKDRLRRHERTNRLMPGYVAYDLDEIGIQGLVNMLEKGSLLSGRGEFKSPLAALQYTRNQHRKQREADFAAARDNAIQKAKAVRRRIQGLPLVSVGIDLNTTRSSGVSS